MSNIPDTKEEKQVPAVEDAAQELISQEITADDLDEVNGGSGLSIGIALNIPF